MLRNRYSYTFLPSGLPPSKFHTFMNQNPFLPEPLPADPLPLFADWFREARAQAVQPNPDAMVLATVNNAGKPSARVVLCKQLVDTEGYVVFYTNYESRKGRELLMHPQAAVVIHWDTLQRQVRLEGRIVQSPAAESDAYFCVRPTISQVGSWSSQQSQPLASREQLSVQVREVQQRFASELAHSQPLPRPPHWGGFRLWIETIELWIEGPGRVHDRAVWNRSLNRKDEFSFHCGAWQGTRLNP